MLPVACVAAVGFPVRATSLAIFALVTEPSTKIAVVTELSTGTLMSV